MASWLGIDPGLHGAAALLNASATPLVVDTPTLVSGGKRRYAVSLMHDLLAELPADHAVLERVHAMPGQGVVSMFSMGYGVGLWEGLLAGLGIPYTLVAPQTWKAHVLRDMARDKTASRLRALQLFPSVGGQLKTASSHNRAEALLLAYYGSTRLSTGSPD